MRTEILFLIINSQWIITTLGALLSGIHIVFLQVSLCKFKILGNNQKVNAEHPLKIRERHGICKQRALSFTFSVTSATSKNRVVPSVVLSYAAIDA